MTTIPIFKERYKMKTFPNGIHRTVCELVLKEDWETFKAGDIVSYGVARTGGNPNINTGKKLVFATAMRIFMSIIFDGELDIEDIDENQQEKEQENKKAVEGGTFSKTTTT